MRIDHSQPEVGARYAPRQNSAIPGAPSYLTIYDIEADDVMDAFRQLGQATMDGKVIMTDDIRSDPPSTFFVYEEITPTSAAPDFRP